MYKLPVLIPVLLCSACAQLSPSPIPPAPSKQAQAVVFDIDGTLTPSVPDIVTARKNAANVAKVYADRGYRIIYLTTRNGFFSAGIPDWLAKHGFPESSVHVAQTSEDRCHPEIYKQGILEQYQASDWNLTFAYGDSSTDFTAYRKVGIPKAHIFALRRTTAESCLEGEWQECLPGYDQHLETLQKTLPPVQKN